MSFVEMLSEGESSTTPKPEWAAVRDAVDRVTEGHSLSLLLEGAEDAWLSISHAEGHGVQVMAIEDGELAEKVLVDSALPTVLVATKIGGLPQQEIRSTLVSKDLALEAAREFLETGRRSVRLTWRDPHELEREGSRSGEK
jgi:hypothetical protein